MKKNLVLVGMMASGKTTLGKIVAKKQNLKFIDTDLNIEKKNSMTISEIFKKKGEDFFRYEEEKEALKYIKKNTKNIAVAFDVIEHTTDPIELLNNINNKMKVDGLLFLTFPNADSYKSRLLNSSWSMVVPLAHINLI